MVQAAVSIRAVTSVAAFAASYGVRPEELLADAGVDPALTADPDARISHSQVVRVWGAAAARSGDEDFGLHMAEWLRPEEHYDIIGYLCRSSATLGEGVRRLSRYSALLHQRTSFLIEERGDVAHCVHQVHGEPGPAPRHPVEFLLATLVVQARRSTGRPLAPRLVRFRHEAPPSIAEHLRVFGAPVRFGAEASEIIIDGAVLDEPQRSADPGLCAILDRQAEAELRRVQAAGAEADGVVGRTRGAVLALLRDSDGEPTLERAAARLRMSPRSLQRHLGAEGQSFRGVLDDVRRELALRHLGERKLAISEIGFLLGFSEVSAFHRAFRRWTGATPAAYRPR